MNDTRIEKSLKLAIVITALAFVVEVIGGLVSGSLSLLGDAGHMLRDVFALLISLAALDLSKKLPTVKKTFGYHRTEIFAAFINGLLLIGISVWIFWEAYRRFSAPRPIRSVTMFIVALIGLLANLYIMFRLRGSRDLNVKSAFIHVLTDALSSVAVMAASVWIFFTGQTIVDPILGLAIAAFILLSSLTIIRDSAHILLEYTPRNVSLNDVIRDIESVAGVGGVHDVHLWTLCSNINMIDAHIFTKERDVLRIEIIKGEIKRRLEKYNIKHATLEFECEECADIDWVKKMEH
jgi:cobalt-zinc-cadmium efflux system protein